MKREKLAEALDHIDMAHIAEAAAPVKKKKKALPWISAVAAILALVFAIHFIEIPIAVQAEAVSLAQTKPQSSPDQQTSAEALGRIQAFLKESTATFLTGDGNQLYSPINAVIGLATVTELTAGNTRQQLLDTLGVPDTETLARYVSALWETVSKDNGYDVCTLASSLWLDDGLRFQKPVMDTLASDYYVSVYRQDLQKPQASRDIQAWLNNNTGGFLKDSVQGVQLPAEALLALYSTIYFQAKWSDEFNASRNTQDVFHGPAGDTTATFMNKKLAQMNYYWGDSFGAVNLNLKNRSQMWFILPDPDKTVEDVLQSGEYWELTQNDWKWERQKKLKVNLSLPKFDISTQADLIDGMKNLGITDVFSPDTSDFSAITEMSRLFVGKIDHAVRVAIDEEGVIAASYTVIGLSYGEIPTIPDDEIDFTLDRPFLFLVTSQHNLPLFTGVVEQP
jgi:serine protease inhibitor